MKQCIFLDKKGTYQLKNPEYNMLYFPIAGEQGMKGAVTPNLGGDMKTSQNTFLLQPVSVEDLHNNKSTRNFWCCIEGEDAWSATGVSAKQRSEFYTDDKEECLLTAGIMWHQVERTAKSNGLHSRITSFVPNREDQIEIMQVEIGNIGLDTVRFTPTAAIPLYARSADNIRDHRHVTSLLHRVKTSDYAVEVTPTLTFDERGHQENEITYFVLGVTGDGEKPVGFYPIVEDFTGDEGSFEHPEAVIKKADCIGANVALEGYEALGGIRFEDCELKPGEKKEFTVILGLTKSRGDIDRIAKEYDTTSKVEKVLSETKAYWDEKCNVSYQTSDNQFDNFMYWVNFQPILRRIYGCSFLPHHDYGKGGRGWRDLWQDCLALLIMNPDGVKEMIIDNFGGVRIDGSNATIIGTKQGEFIADRNNITRVWMDHGVWPLITTKLYINQTGDIDILLRDHVYFKDKQVARGTQTDKDWQEGSVAIQLDAQGKAYQGSILEHLLIQNLTAFYEVGEHNHMRLRGADWNDALDMADKNGESVAFSAAYAGNLEDLSELIGTLEKDRNMSTISIAKEMELLLTMPEELFDSVQAKKELLLEYFSNCNHVISGERVEVASSWLKENLHKKAEWIKQHIGRTEWIEGNDIGWFNGYYDDHSRKVEGFVKDIATGEEQVRMMLTSQVFTIMSKTATQDQIKQIVKAADQYLYEESVGGYRLNTNFKEVKTDLGRMFGFAYGHKENGAVFSHMTTMYANALYQRGFAKEGYKALNTLYKQAINFNVSKIYPGIPEYFNDRGKGMYHYLTGAASWLMLTVVTQMYGVKGHLGALAIEPKLLKEQFDSENQAQVRLTFGKKKWHITFVNENAKEYGDYKVGKIVLNGTVLETTDDMKLIPCEEIVKLDSEAEQEVLVILE